VKLTRSSLSVDLLESQKFNLCSLIASTERPSTSPSTQMRPLPTVLPFKLLSLPEKVTKPLKSSSSSMSPHFPKVLVSQEVSCLLLSRETPPSQLNRPQTIPLMPITKPVSSLMFTKERERCSRTTISLVNSPSTEFPQHQKVPHRFRLPSKLMLMVFLMFRLVTPALVDNLQLLLPTIREDFLQKRSKR